MRSLVQFSILNFVNVYLDKERSLYDQLEMNDNLIFLILIVSVGIILLLIGFFLLFHKSQLKIAAQHKRLHEEKLIHHQDLIKASVASQDQERKRIGRDLHDSIGTSLTVLRLSIEQFELLNITKQANLSEFLQECKAKIDRVIQSCRSISHHLSPEIFTLNTLSESIQELSHTFPFGGSIKLYAPASIWKYLDTLNEEEAINIYRILEELLNNTVRHASATKIAIHINIIYERLHIQYQDNGIGVKQKTLQVGHGLQHIESRLLVLGGQYEPVAVENTGYHLNFSIPLNIAVTETASL